MGLTREELAELSGISARTIAELELGNTKKPHTTTVSLLADALELTDDAREEFKAAARDPAAMAHGDRAISPAPPRGDDSNAWLAFIVLTLDERGVPAARSAVAQWQDRMSVDDTWLAWVDRLLTLTGEGKLPPAAPRPLPTDDPGLYVGREQQAADLGAFLDRVQQGRGGLALVLGPKAIGKSRLATRVLARRISDSRAEWITFVRGEAGYLGWRRLLALLWTTVRRTELAPVSASTYARILDDILLVGSDSERQGGISRATSRQPSPRC